jgi:hypothetical protein
MDAYRFVSALSQAAQRHGTQLQYGEVVGLQQTGERVTGVCLGRCYHCMRDPGASHGRLTGVALRQWLGLTVPIGPYPPEAARPPGRSYAALRRRWGDVNMVARRDGVMHGAANTTRQALRRIPPIGPALAVGTVPDGLPEPGVEVVEARAVSPKRLTGPLLLVHCRDTPMSMCLYPARMAFCCPQ